ncbi:hypothetical protein GGTG_07591 [Gaeumannomyces tritici R3-111a-1]|uniref:Uncharacterized protein n=1 Tax=Gaeumannomyces tritici (strain R3-111a-1) TaxID=644352 RepID=J3P243_GAET3|nr:hypothetical protein GGTG_07591 [Gaeumannomyces tritici R3-111a-1]EJT73735.1 hypothetical protein GGTG_07591 [Gaeumannomyces tritici R3-111a-1]
MSLFSIVAGNPGEPRGLGCGCVLAPFPTTTRCWQESAVWSRAECKHATKRISRFHDWAVGPAAALALCSPCCLASCQRGSEEAESWSRRGRPLGADTLPDALSRADASL